MQRRRRLGRLSWGWPIDKVITTALIIIASVVASVVMVNAVYPAVASSSNSLVRIASRVDERIETQISIVYATGELDENQVWQDTDGDTFFDVWLWIKNVGSARILSIDQTDLFFGPDGNVVRIPHVNDAGGGYPSWSYTIENDTEWKAKATIKIAIHYSSALASDTYFAKVVTPSGASAKETFSF